jgi:hypothetical protein
VLQGEEPLNLHFQPDLADGGDGEGERREGNIDAAGSG